MQMLTLENLHVTFDGYAALAGAQLVVREGERHGLVGANGSGKSTLLDVAGGQIAADEGRVLLDGRDVSHARVHERARARIGRVFQEGRLCATLSAREHLALADDVKRASGATLGTLRAAANLADAWLDCCPSQLTLLERRRLELVLAMYGADVLLCDEIAAGLGPVESEGFYALIDGAVAAGWIRGAVLVEHRLELLLGHATRVSVMSEGRVVASAGDSPDAMEATVARHLFPRRRDQP